MINIQMYHYNVICYGNNALPQMGWPQENQTISLLHFSNASTIGASLLRSHVFLMLSALNITLLNLVHCTVIHPSNIAISLVEYQ